MQERRSIQPEDLFALQFLNDGALSPDGERVVYTISQIDAEADKEYAALYLLDLASGEARRLTHGEQSDRGARWSPNGKAIAFISDRSGLAQLHLLPVDGGEARQLSDFERGVGGGLAWSPDGAKIAFSAKADAEAPNLGKEAYRVDRTVYRFDAIGYLDDEAQDIYALDVASSAITRLTDDRSNNSNPRWAADGGSILYDANMQPTATRAMTPDLMRVDLAGNSSVVLSGWASLAAASLTPNNQRIVFIGRPDDGKPIGTKADLYVLDIAAGTIDCRTSGLDVGVGGRLSLDMPIGALGAGNVAIADDGDSAFATVQRGGTNHIYRIALSGAESWQPVTAGDCAIFPLDLVGQQLLYAQTSMNAPPELRLKRLDEATSQQLTALNEAHLAGIDLPAWSRLTWRSVDNVEVEGWYLTPPVGEAPYPTILYIHGGPHAAYGYGFHFDFQMLAGAGYGVLFLNHRASTGYGDAFSTAIKGDWGNLDYQDLMSGVDYTIAQGLADAERLGVCGTSGGGNLSCWIIGQTGRFKAAIPQNPVTNWRSFYGTSDIGIYFGVEQMGGHPHEIPEVYAKCSPLTYAHRCTTPTLLVQSELDYRCPAEQSEQFYTVLKAVGCEVEMLRQPGGYHGASIRGAVNLRRAHNDAMLEWFARYV
ncbi:MAG: S9 family peptidase [Chloroflexi bacterium]|nr:S9 family peptidase [Chloroflexota bacterium]MCY3583505.1 S9 family peptidase [Chloroflexota bacterium]MCY3716182.1 S9 family peptidase [Chloroflexota bacterium]MDE2650863.1 S9 family peptidase [Chloroflexota bacterium]MXX49750.1 S9 family peptidase [Chloroflexota bacterium]